MFFIPLTNINGAKIGITCEKQDYKLDKIDKKKDNARYELALSAKIQKVLDMHKAILAIFMRKKEKKYLL